MRETGYIANHLGILNAANGQGFGSVGPDTLSPEQPAIMAACSTMDDSVRLAHRVSALVDRLCGAVPVGQATKGVEQNYSSLFDGLRAQAQNASIQIQEAMDALNRLDRELP